MRIQGLTTTGIASQAPSARRSAGSSFTLGEAETARSPVGAAAPRHLGGIDALIALQGFDDPTERRRRAIKHGRHALDVLDELKLGLLAGALDPGTLRRLQFVAADLKGTSGDGGLDGVLAEIDLRVGVELAKAGIG